MIRLATRLADQPPAFEMLAAGALQLLESQPAHVETLVRLADQALLCGRRARALNLNRERQLLSCMLTWYRELPSYQR